VALARFVFSGKGCAFSRPRWGGPSEDGIHQISYLELSIIMLVLFLGWHFALAEFVGRAADGRSAGSSCFRTFFLNREAFSNRPGGGRPNKGIAGRMEGHAEDGHIRDRGSLALAAQ